MKIILTSIGTRGDVEPFLAIGEMLQKRGHSVLCLFPEQFRDLADDANLAFASLGSRFIEMLESTEGKAALGGGGKGVRKMLSLIRLARNYGDVNRELIDKQFNIIEAENPDRVVHNGKAIYAMIWGLKNSGRTILLSPIPYVMHYVKGHSHLAFNRNYGSFLNKLTYAMATFGLVKRCKKQ
jgi:UDP:flavonoid glycosyltransferase YjiC (YdhE family)